MASDIDMARWTSQLITIAVGGMIAWLLFMQVFVWQVPLLGIVIGLSFVGFLTYLWRDILHHVFRFERGFISLFLSAFAALFFFSAGESIILTFYTTTLFLTYINLASSMVLSYVLRLFLLHRSHGYSISGQSARESIMVFPKIPLLSWIYLFVWIVTIGLFFKTNGTTVFFSPWQSLSVGILPLIFLSTLLLGVLIFSRSVTKHVMIFILLQSILIHLYMPLSHTLPWGGDVWRHIGVEEQLADGDSIPPVLFGPEARWREVYGADIPEVFVIPQKYSYGQFWSLAVITHQLTRISFENINIWMIPLLWSLLFPLILFRLGRLVLHSWRGGLLFAWLSFLAFPLQALGALSLPVSLGVLTFFFWLMLLLQYSTKPHTSQKIVLWLFGFLMLFGYALSFLLAVFVAVAVWAFGKIDTRIENTLFQWALVGVLTFVGVLFFPVVELVAHTSILPTEFHMVDAVKSILGQSSGWYYAKNILSHDVLSGNLIFNHTPSYAYVSSFFTAWRWWIVPFMISLWGVLLYALIVFLREKKTFVSLLSVWLFVSLLGAYKIGWFFLVGDRTLIRRFDPYITTCLLLFVSFGVLLFFSRLRYISYTLRLTIVMLFLLVIAWSTTSTYASGPDMRSTSRDEYDVARFVVNQTQDIPDSVCVLADTWVLLPVEGLSRGALIGGQFPIDYQFGQTERVHLYETFVHADVTSDDVQTLFDMTNTSHCVVVLPDDMSEESMEKISIALDTLPVRYAHFLIWDAYDASLNLKTE